MYMKRWSRGFVFCNLFYRNYTIQNPTGLHTTDMKPLGRAFVWSHDTYFLEFYKKEFGSFVNFFHRPIDKDCKD